MHILAYLPKMKVGLSDHKSALNRLVEVHEIWYGGNAIQGDLDAIIFNPRASIILKLLRFKIVR
jgi:hypothetical protein